MLGERLRIARKKAGLSLRELAAIMDPPVSAQAISKYEANEMMPSSRVLVGLGKALGVSLDFLMSGEVEELEGVLAAHGGLWNARGNVAGQRPALPENITRRVAGFRSATRCWRPWV